jgi:hypothetical protein
MQKEPARCCICEVLFSAPSPLPISDIRYCRGHARVRVGNAVVFEKNNSDAVRLLYSDHFTLHVPGRGLITRC